MDLESATDPTADGDTVVVHSMDRLARNLDRKDHALDEAVRLLLAVVNQLADVKICD